MEKNPFRIPYDQDLEESEEIEETVKPPYERLQEAATEARTYTETTRNAITYIQKLNKRTLTEAELRITLKKLGRQTYEGLELQRELKEITGPKKNLTLEEKITNTQTKLPRKTTFENATETIIELSRGTAYDLRTLAAEAWDYQQGN